MSSDSCSIVDSLSDDLMGEILIRLPVKSLVRFTLVSKPWRSLISSPRFVKSQFRHAISRLGDDQALIVFKKLYDPPMTPLNLHSNQLGAPLGVPYPRDKFSFTPFTSLAGSHDGIVCVSVSSFRRRQLDPSKLDKFHNHDIYIWNPRTRQSKLIPPHSIREKLRSVSVGFGYDPVGDEFKVLRNVLFLDKSFSAEVYSMNTNAWRKVDPGPNDSPLFEEFDVCVKGLLCCNGVNGLMAFDLNREVFKSGIKLPHRCSSPGFRSRVLAHNSRITVFKDSIAVAFFSKRAKLSGKVKLWTLDDDACFRGGEVEASWTLVLSVQVDSPLPVRFVRGYFNNGDILLEAGEDTLTWLLYNIDKKEAKPIPRSVYVKEVIKYNESLVSIGG